MEIFQVIFKWKKCKKNREYASEHSKLHLGWVFCSACFRTKKKDGHNDPSFGMIPNEKLPSPTR
jgi:hypothetical protein